jgi:hypothetical protein
MLWAVTQTTEPENWQQLQTASQAKAGREAKTTSSNSNSGG